MELKDSYFNEQKEKARKLYSSQGEIFCPFFKNKIILNSDGFHHLQFSARRERNKREQLLKFSLLPLAFGIIKKSGTIQEYRKLLTPIGKRSPKDRMVSMKNVEYFGLVAIFGSKQIKIKVVLRKVGDGNTTFWSVMPFAKLKNGQKLYIDGIDDE